MYDAIVIGGGIVGTSAAYRLVQQGARALLLDREDLGRATDAGAGIISPEAYNGDDHPWYRLLAAGLEYYPGLVGELEAAQVGDVGYARCGQLIAAIGDEENRVLEANIRQILTLQRERGFPAAEDLRQVSAAEARRLFPPLAPTAGTALFYRQAARVDGRLLNTALRRAAEKGGLEVRRDGVAALVLEEGAVRGVQTAAGRIGADRVIIAGGAWSPSLGEQLGLRLPVTPDRGQIAHLHLDDIDTAHWPIVFGVRGHYMVPWPDGRIVVGATHEDAGFEARATAAGLSQVLSEALRLAPGLAEAEFVEVRVGLRPVSADGLPVLGAVPGVEGVFVATGHGAVGLHLGPLSGRLVADMALGKRRGGLDLSVFDPGRF